MGESRPTCVAQTKDLNYIDSASGSYGIAKDSAPNFLRSASWYVQNDFGVSMPWNLTAERTPDGTCLLASSEDNKLNTFVVPPDILSSETLTDLDVYSQFSPGEPIYAFSTYPYYDLRNPSSTLVLSSIRDHPLQLTNALINDSSIVASYPLVSPTTEIYHAPHSLTFNAAGNHFIAGSGSLIAVFDLNRNGEEPIERVATIPSRRKKLKGGGVGMKGLVSSLDISTDKILAAGTFTRCIGLYGNEGLGDCIAVFSLAGQTLSGEAIGGSGVTQVLWSPCGRYLNVAERKSDGIMVYDVRVAGKLLCWLRGRKANTNQRLGINAIQTSQNFEIWAGGTDGFVRYWRNPGLHEGSMEATYEWKGHRDAISSTCVHQSGSVVMTSSGHRQTPQELNTLDNGFISAETKNSISDNSESKSTKSLDQISLVDASLRIWSLT